VQAYRDIYDRFLSGGIDARDKRSDLGADNSLQDGAKENITQIMWPSALYPQLLDMPLHEGALAVARELVGDDMVLDFDMLIDKAPTPTPPPPGTRTPPTGSTCPIPARCPSGSPWTPPHPRQRLHVVRPGGLARNPHPPPPAGSGGGGGAIECDCSEDEPGATPVPLNPGEAAAYGGATFYYSRGNSTDSHRRAYILNYRSACVIQLVGDNGMDHGLTTNERTVRNADATSPFGPHPLDARHMESQCNRSTPGSSAGCVRAAMVAVRRSLAQRCQQ
jgi:hypothetical protein